MYFSFSWICLQFPLNWDQKFQQDQALWSFRDRAEGRYRTWSHITEDFFFFFSFCWTLIRDCRAFFFVFPVWSWIQRWRKAFTPHDGAISLFITFDYHKSICDKLKKSETLLKSEIKYWKVTLNIFFINFSNKNTTIFILFRFVLLFLEQF